MSSAYPPPGGQWLRRCQRCGTPLALDVMMCNVCGLYNAPQQPDPAQIQQMQWQSTPAAMAGQGVQPSAPPVINGGNSQFIKYGQATPTPNAALWAHSQDFTYAQGNTNGNPPNYGNGFQAASSGSLNPPEPRGSNILLTVLVIALVCLLVGGGLTGWLYFKSANQSTNTTSTFVIVTPSTKPLFRDTFQNDSTGWDLTSNPGKFSVKVGSGSMVLEDDDNELLWEILPGKNFADFRLDVDAKLSKGDQGNGYGVYIRGASTATSEIGTYYRLELYGDGSFALYKGTLDANGNTLNNPIVNPIINSAILKEGQFNHITIIAKGSSMTFMVNGVTIYTYNDTSYKGGLIAPFVSNLTRMSPGAQATFSNLAIFPAS